MSFYQKTPFLLWGLICISIPSRSFADEGTKSDMKSAGKDVGHAVKDTGKSIGHTLKNGGKAIGHAAKDGVHAVKNTAKKSVGKKEKPSLEKNP